MTTRTVSRRRSRTALLTAGIGVALALLPGCSKDQPVVVGTGDPASTTAPTADGGGGDGRSADPLTAQDLPGWAAEALPDAAAASLVYPCGDAPTGARDQQAAVRATALSTPTSVTVLNQVADYDGVDPIVVIQETISRALGACPAYSTDTHDVLVRGLAAPTTSPMVGAEIVRTDHATGLRDVTVYWAALAGTHTVEVSVSATLGATGENPLGAFALDVLAASQAKVAGQKVPAVSAPTLGDVQTQQEADAQRAALEADRQAVVDGSAPADGQDVPAGADVDDDANLPTGWQNTIPTPVYQGEGETPPPSNLVVTQD